MIARLRRLVASLLVVSIAGLGLPLPAQAGIVSTDAALASAERDRIASMLERADVRAQLEAYGVRAADVKASVAPLTDEEAARPAGQILTIPIVSKRIRVALGPVFVGRRFTLLLRDTQLFLL